MFSPFYGANSLMHVVLTYSVCERSVRRQIWAAVLHLAVFSNYVIDFILSNNVHNFMRDLRFSRRSRFKSGSSGCDAV